MAFSNFLAACAAEPKVQLSHFICVSEETILEEYAVPPYRMDTLRLCYSMTKSFASLAVGIAWDQGLLKLDDRVGDILPDCMPPQGHPAWKIRVRDLLTMSGGVHETQYSTLIREKDWVRAYLHQDLPHEPGTYYCYSTHGSHVLSAIVERVSGLSLEVFLNRYLFHPMGILEAQWETAPEGRTAGGMGLSLYPVSLARIAQLLLNGGRYAGRQLISKAYLKQATGVQILKQDQPKEKIYGGNGYGFQFHIGKDGYYRMDGAFGQVCLVCPEKHRAFVALSSGSNTEKLLELIYAHFLEEEASVPVGRYRMEENPLGIQEIALCAAEKGYVFSMRVDEDSWKIHFCPGKETQGRTRFIKDLQVHEQEYVCSAQQVGKVLTLRVHYIETPYIAVYCLEKCAVGIRLHFSVNVSFTLRDFSADGIRTES